MITYVIHTCNRVGCSLSMLAPGSVAIPVNSRFNASTIYINRYAKEGISRTNSERYRIRLAAGTTTRFANRK